MKPTRFLSAAAILASSLAAQSYTIPSKAATTAKGSYFNVYAFYGTSSTSPASQGHTLCLYDTSDIGTPVLPITTIAFRRPINFSTPAVSANVTLTMSMSPLASTAISSTFASNHGASPAVVFNGPVSLPAQNGTAWPTNFEAPLVLSAPFIYAASLGSSLAIELTTDQSASASRNVWYVEDYRIESGENTQVLYMQNCKHSGGSTIGSWSYNPPNQVVGGTFFYQAYGYPNNLASFTSTVLALGATGPGGTWGGLNLPFSLASVLIPAPSPSCQWGIDVLATVPATYVTSTSSTANQGSMRVNLPIPNVPALADAFFFTQFAGLDTNPVTSGLELFPSHAVRWTIGSGAKVPGAMVANLGSNSAPTGSVLTSEAITFKLN